MPKNNTELPDGFIPINPDRKPQITFDLKTTRFYIALSLREEFGLKWGSRFSVAYNSLTRQILIDLKGMTLRLDKRGYVTSVRFAEELRKIEDYAGMSNVKYTFNPDISSDRFILLDETEIND